jgi:hypothetical protein
MKELVRVSIYLVVALVLAIGVCSSTGIQAVIFASTSVQTNGGYSNPVVGAIPCGRPGRVQDPPLPTHFECAQTNALALHNTTTSAPKPTGRVIPESTIVLLRKPTAIVTRATGTVTTTTVAADVATHTAVVRPSPSSPLLDRLVKNKPSIWGNKGFYVLLGALYLTLMGLFLKRVLDTLKRQP